MRLRRIKSKSCGLLKTWNRASYHLPAVCIKQVFIITVAVCSHSRCCFGHVAWRESSTPATAFPLLLNLLHSLFQLILKYFVLRSITSCSPYRSLHLSESGGISIPATCHVLMLEKGIRPFPLCYKEVSHILRRYLIILHLPWALQSNAGHYYYTWLLFQR